MRDLAERVDLRQPSLYAALLQLAGVGRAEDVDLFTAICAGLTHQQVANDPGGDRWVAQARRVVGMFLAEVRRQPSE